MDPLANPPMRMHNFFFLLVLTSTCATATTVVASLNRRTLHEPFFPQDPPILPPVQPPSALPPSSPPSLNVPFLSTPTPTTTPTNDQPFFPSFPSPPPPPPQPSASSSASFPANISSLNLPTSPKPKRVSSKLIPIAITLAIAAVVVLFIVAFLRIKKRRYHDDSQSLSDEKPQRSYTNSVFSAAANNVGGVSGGGNSSYNRIPKLNRPSQTSSEFLYLGTLVNSHGGVDATGTSGRHNRGEEESSLQKVGSPELRPLPPLSGSGGGRSQTIMQNGCYETSEVESKDEEFDEFYSPRASDGGGSGARRAFTVAAATGNYQSRRSIGSVSSSSYSSSSSGSPARSISLSISPPVSLSPRNSRLKSPDLVAIQTAPPPSRPPPPPPPPPHPLIIPSPDVGLSKNSLESSPRLSNSSNDQSSPLARIPPPPQPPTKHRETLIPTTPPPATRLNPPVLIKPARHVPISSHQPAISPTEMLPINQENLETNEKAPKPKLKPLHWDKVRASSDHEMVWDHLKSSSFKLNEEMIETLFIVKPPNANSNEKSTIKRQILSSTISHENLVLDPKKSQNIAISLRALGVTTEEVCDALLEGNADTLGTELLESLMKMAPTKEEERKLQEHQDDSPLKLGPAEKFLKAVLDVPFAFRRVGAMLFVSNFDSEVEYLEQSFQTLEAACEELKNSRMFLKLLEAVLKTGNRMNIGTNRGDAQAFKLDTLLKLIDVKGADGKTTLLHFVVQEIVRTEGLSNVKKAAGMDSEVLNGDVVRLTNGIANIMDVVRLIEAGGSNNKTFSNAMKKFLKIAQEEVIKIHAQEAVSLSVVKEITEYFHGNSVKFEAQPFRIFMVVRDFLTVLDRVCKEVGSINMESTQKLPVMVNRGPVFDGFHGKRQYSSSDDESSSSL
ncbi:unnamed protein product [Lactuca virosa]|uniref:Formin-like protein n=1 Tax=Lactuca virosa TaxID=75947 RepID=A0AAU9PX14_9ASTR|nr:unnamed protein product [Lactuca virosa]